MDRYLEIRRQLLHIVDGVIIITLLDIFGKELSFILLGLSIALMAVLKVHKKLKLKIVDKILRLLEREENMSNPGAGGVTYLVGTGLTIFLFDPQTAKLGICALSFGDAGSTLIGKYLGKREITFIKKITGKRRTLEGSIGFILGTIIVGSPFIGFKNAAFVGIIGTILEILTPIDDNIVIPIFTSLTMHLINVLF